MDTKKTPQKNHDGNIVKAAFKSVNNAKPTNPTIAIENAMGIPNKKRKTKTKIPTIPKLTGSIAFPFSQFFYKPKKKRE